VNTQPTLIIEMVRFIAFAAATFGIAINAADQATLVVILGASFAIGSAILAFINRSKVFSQASAQRIANAATYEPAGTIVDIGTPGHPAP
jgi:hypothetical protein